MLVAVDVSVTGDSCQLSVADALTLLVARNNTCTHHFNKPIVVVVVATLLSWTQLLQNFSLVGMKVRL